MKNKSIWFWVFLPITIIPFIISFMSNQYINRTNRRIRRTEKISAQHKKRRKQLLEAQEKIHRNLESISREREHKEIDENWHLNMENWKRDR